jgi:hypothetical protein
MRRFGSIIAPMYWFENLPWWAKVPLIIGGALMSAFSNSFPQGLQTAGLILGILIALFGCVAVAWHFVRTEFANNFALQWPIRRKEVSSAAATPQVPLHIALYVGHFWADFTQIKAEMYFTITIRIFNQADQNITVERVRGNLVLERFTKMAAVSLAENLPLTIVAHNHDGTTVTIRQGVSKEQKERICEVLASGETLIFDFDLIRFLVHEHDRTELIWLHNLDGVTCRLPKEGDIICSRLVKLHAQGLVVGRGA